MPLNRHPLLARLFSPWRWGRWLWLWFGLAVLLALATPVPVEMSLDAINAPPQVIAVTDAIYTPAWWCAHRSGTIYRFFGGQAHVMVKLFGPPKNYRKCGIWISHRFFQVHELFTTL